MKETGTAGEGERGGERGGETRAEGVDDVPSMDLVRAAQDGDQGALNDLVDRYYERVRRIIRIKLGVNLRRYMDSGDILQGTFIAAVRGFERFEVRDESSLIHWLARIAERQIQDAHDHVTAQKRDRRREVPLAAPDPEHSSDIERDLGGDDPSPSVVVALGEDRALLEACLADLREDYRDVILHREYEGGSWKQVAEWMDSPTADAARMLYARALTDLSERVRERGSGR